MAGHVINGKYLSYRPLFNYQRMSQNMDCTFLESYFKNSTS